EDNLKRQKLSLSERVKQEEAFRKKTENEKQAFANRMKKLSGQLEETQSQIAAKERELEKALQKGAQSQAQYQSKLADLKAEKEAILGKLQEQETGFQKSIEKLQTEQEAKIQAAREAFQKSLQKEKLSADARRAKELAYRQQADAERK